MGVLIMSYHDIVQSYWDQLFMRQEQTDVQHAARPFLMVWVWLARLFESVNSDG